MKKRDLLLLAGLLGKLGELLDEKYEYEIQRYQYPYFRTVGSDRAIKEVNRKIIDLMDRSFPTETPTGEQRAIRGMAE